MERAIELSQVQNAFLAEPLTTKEEMATFYIDTAKARYGCDDTSIAEELALELSDCTNAYIHRLFIGHMGSGKSTELRMLEENLDRSQFFTVFINADKEIDMNDAEYTDILFLIVDKLLNKADQDGFKIDKKVYERLYSYWNSVYDIECITGTQMEASLETEASMGIKALVLHLLAKVKGILKSTEETRSILRQRIEPRSSELINQIIDIANFIKSNLEKQGGNHNIPVIILDGTDKIPLDAAKKVFHDNGIKFSDLPMHVIVSFPIALSYASEFNLIQTWFPSPNKLPMIKQRKWVVNHYEEYPDGQLVMKKIVEKRMELHLFDEGVLELLIMKTGGSIRDLFRCIKKATLRARIKGEEKIIREYAIYALNDLKSDINGRYLSSDIPELDKIYHGDKARTGDPSIIKLLQSGAVMEYNASRWCDLHPLVEEWLLDTGRMQDDVV